MNNAEYFNGRNGQMGLEDAFLKWCREQGIQPNGLSYRSVLNFAKCPAMQALCFDKEQVVQLERNGKTVYGVVTGRHRNAMHTDVGPGAECVKTVYVDTAEESGIAVDDCARTLKAPDFPQALVDLVKAQLRSKCPLAKGECE